MKENCQYCGCRHKRLDGDYLLLTSLRGVWVAPHVYIKINSVVILRIKYLNN